MASFSATARWTVRTLLATDGFRPRRLLVVDDNQPGAEAVAALLVVAGYEAQTAHDGMTALRTVAAWVPDIAVLDINMPSMDGYGLARRLRQDALTQQTILVAFTSLDEAAARPNGVACGFDAFCQKGVAVEPLLRLLEALAP